MSNINPNRVVVTFGGATLIGFAESFIKVSRTTPSFSTSVGADGLVDRIQSNDKRGTVEVSLQASSPSNDVLAAKLAADELSGLAVSPLVILDLNGRTVCEAPVAWISGPPEVSFGTDAGERTWKFECANLAMFVGGGNL